MQEKEEYAHYIASLAQRAILYEVSTTPKPGLVDRDNSGAHEDMDFFTFMSSSSAIYKGLYECVMEGMLFNEGNNQSLLDGIRKIGIRCENDMYKATNGVNTHKGIIFSFGILCSVIGKLYKEKSKNKFLSEEICNEVKKVTKGLTDRDFRDIYSKENLTHGELLFIKYGYKGIRGEVEGGFNTIISKAIKILRDWKLNNTRQSKSYITKRLSLNDLFLEVLLTLMAESEDTNVIIRSGISGLNYTQTVCKAFLASGGMYQIDAKTKLENMNQDFIRKNISPGGAADLLAVSIFFGMLEGIL
jgi:triphosphoribosyl-dephospho-CoA synthase